MAWIIPENKLDTQQRDFLDNVDIDRRKHLDKRICWFR